MGRQVRFWDSVLYSSNQLSISWDFGDGNTATSHQAGMGATHTYAAAGTYTVTLCVYDSVRNDTACTSRSVVVAANCPQVSGTILGPDTLCIAAPHGVFSAIPSSGSSNPQYSYRWQIGNSTYFSQTVTHTFTSTGTFGITLRIIDWSIPDTVYIHDTVVVAPAPACLQPLQVSIQGQDSLCAFGFNSTLLSANVSGGSGLYQYAWSDSRGRTGSNSTFFAWSNSVGTVTVWLDVTDGATFFGSDTFQIHFTTNNCPPIQPNFYVWPDTPAWDVRYNSGIRSCMLPIHCQ
ncbi:MAG: PKD domain-containing protein [Bacteroidia bacterium]